MEKEHRIYIYIPRTFEWFLFLSSWICNKLVCSLDLFWFLLVLGFLHQSWHKFPCLCSLSLVQIVFSEAIIAERSTEGIAHLPIYPSSTTPLRSWITLEIMGSLVTLATRFPRIIWRNILLDRRIPTCKTINRSYIYIYIKFVYDR